MMALTSCRCCLVALLVLVATGSGSTQQFNDAEFGGMASASNALVHWLSQPTDQKAMANTQQLTPPFAAVNLQALPFVDSFTTQRASAPGRFTRHPVSHR